LWDRGYPAVAMFGAYISWEQVAKLRRFFERVVIVPDGDAAGRSGAKDAWAKLSPHMITVIVNTPEGKDPDDLSLAETRDLLGPPPSRSNDDSNSDPTTESLPWRD